MQTICWRQNESLNFRCILRLLNLFWLWDINGFHGIPFLCRTDVHNPNVIIRLIKMMMRISINLYTCSFNFNVVTCILFLWFLLPSFQIISRRNIILYLSSSDVLWVYLIILIFLKLNKWIEKFDPYNVVLYSIDTDVIVEMNSSSHLLFRIRTASDVKVAGILCA